MLANPTIATSEPDYSDDPALSSVTPDETGGSDIYVPHLSEGHHGPGISTASAAVTMKNEDHKWQQYIKLSQMLPDS